MLLNFNAMNRRRRRKSLREEFLSSKATRNRIGDDMDLNLDLLGRSDKPNLEDSYLTSTPASLKGSLLRNKLDNPLFKPLSKHSRLSLTGYGSFSKKSALKKVQNASDVDEEEESEQDDDGYDEDGEDETYYDEEADDEAELEAETKPKSRILDLSKFKAQKLRRLKRGRSIVSRNNSSRSRFGVGSSFFDSTMKRNFLFPNRTYSSSSRAAKMRGKSAKSPLSKKTFNATWTRTRRQNRNNRNLRVSTDSNSSNSSNYTSYDNDVDSDDVDILTKLEDSNSSLEKVSSSSSFTESKGHVLYTHKGQAVRLQFFFDYLLISPIVSKLSLSLTAPRHAKQGSKAKPKPKIVYYEDLASWTNNDSCLSLIHIKQKHTAQQQRTEIKLFVNKKKVVATPKQLNEELKDRVSVLIAGKMNCSTTEARKMLERNVTEDEVLKVVQKIDRSGKKCLAQSYTRHLNLVEASAPANSYQILNV